MAYAVQIDVYYYSLEVEFFVWMEPNSDGLFVGLLLVFGLILASGNPQIEIMYERFLCVVKKRRNRTNFHDNQYKESEFLTDGYY